MNNKIILVLLCSAALHCSAQPPAVKHAMDSIFAVLIHQEPKVQLHSQLALAELYAQQRQWAKADTLAESVLKKAVALADRDLLAESYSALGTPYLKGGNLRQSDSLLQLALNYCDSSRQKITYIRIVFKTALCDLRQSRKIEGLNKLKGILESEQLIEAANPSFLIQIYNDLGGLYWEMDSSKLVIPAFEKAVALNEKYHLLQIKPYNNLALYRRNVGNNRGAIQVSLRAKILAEEAKDTIQLAAAFRNIGNIFELDRQLDSVLYYYQIAYQLVQTQNPSATQLVNIVRCVCDVYKKKGDYRAAKDIFQTTLQQRQQIKDTTNSYFWLLSGEKIFCEGKLFNKHSATLALDNILFRKKNILEKCHFYTLLQDYGDLCADQKSYSSAELAYKKVQDYAQKNQNNILLNTVYEAFIKLYNLWWRPQEAIHYYKVYQNLQDSTLADVRVAKSALETNLAELQEQSKLKNMQLNVQQQKSAHQSTLLLLLLCIALCVISIFMLFYSRNCARRQAWQSQLQAKEKEEQLKSFNYAVSHDLRVPLYHAAQSTQLLEKRYGSNSHTADILESVKDAEEMLKGLMDFSQLDNTLPYVSEFDMVELIKNTVADYDRKLARGIISINVPTASVSIRGDRLMLRQVLRNLLDNALKFSSQSSAPSVVVSLSRSEQKWKLSVTDNGIGLPPASEMRIFELFKRVHLCESIAGSGIGLAIVKKIADKHNARVFATNNTSGSGATVGILLQTLT